MTAKCRRSTRDVPMVISAGLLVFLSQAGLGMSSPASPIVPAASPARRGELAVRITSPLGRTGSADSVRIVAQIQCGQSTDIGPVRFYIDGKLFTTDTDGAPY